MWSYSSELLMSFNGLYRALSNPVWRKLVNLKIASNKPTRRGCRAGYNKVRSIKSIISSRTIGNFYNTGQSMLNAKAKTLTVNREFLCSLSQA